LERQSAREDQIRLDRERRWFEYLERIRAARERRQTQATEISESRRTQRIKGRQFEEKTALAREEMRATERYRGRRLSQEQQRIGLEQRRVAASEAKGKVTAEAEVSEAQAIVNAWAHLWEPDDPPEVKTTTQANEAVKAAKDRVKESGPAKKERLLKYLNSTRLAELLKLRANDPELTENKPHLAEVQNIAATIKQLEAELYDIGKQTPQAATKQKTSPTHSPFVEKAKEAARSGSKGARDWLARNGIPWQ
jgi:hypothetical protein